MKLRTTRWTVAVAASATAVATSVVAVRLHIGVAAAIPGFMLLALFASWKSDFMSAVAVSIVSSACLDYFFTEPKFSLAVYSYQEGLALLSFVAVSVFVGHLVQRIKCYSQSLELKEKEQSELFQLSQTILLADWKSGPEQALCRVVQDQLHLRGIAIWDSSASQHFFSGETSDTEESLVASLLASRDCDLPARGEHIRILRFGARPIGAVLFRGSDADPLFLSAVAALIASNLERVRAMRAEVLAESVAVSEQLRTAVLDGLAHSVKTPLTTIVIAASGLAGVGPLNSLQQHFAATIEEQATAIAEVTSKLLKTSRLDHRDVKLRQEVLPLGVICNAAFAELPSTLRDGRLLLNLPEAGIDILSDPEVLRMAVTQLAENALKYSPSNSTVSVSALCVESEVEIAVHNDGTFIPSSERQLIFERYYRSPSTDHRAPGTGLGLSIAKRAAEMHGGTLRVESTFEEGTTFFLTLPRGTPC